LVTGLLGVLCLAALAFSAVASAQVTVGQLAPAVDPEANCSYSEPYDEFQPSVATGTSFVVPASGVLTSWSTLAGGESTGQTLGLKVFRRIGAGVFLVVGQDPRTLTPGVLNTFPLVPPIPVQAGDFLGVAIPKESRASCYNETDLEGDVIAFAEGSVAPGGTISAPEPFGTMSSSSFTEDRLNITASLLPPPVITALSATTGTIAGGPVVIAGANFVGVSAVAVGGVPAPFAVNSEAQITVTVPPSATLATVPITVTTPAGTATAAQTFTYQGCVVPKLKGKKLKAGKKVARSSDCGFGKVHKKKGATAKTGKVVKQSPTPGKVLAPGTKVSVTLK
jgi:hypothetical protein